MVKIVSSIFFVFLNTLNLQAEFNKNKLKFVTIGHSYSTLKTDSAKLFFIKKLNAENADFVFILGDSQLEDSSVTDFYKKNINSTVLFSPGNHEISHSLLSKYKQSVGYLDTTIINDQCNFIVLNSLQSVEKINNYFSKTFNKIKNNNPTIVLTHFRIWDDNLHSESEYQHDKSYLYSDIESVYRNKIDYIFAGNSSAQYFGKQYCLEHKVNRDIVFWTDIVDNTTCYAIGMKYKTNYTCSVLSGSQLYTYPVSIDKALYSKKKAYLEKEKSFQKKKVSFSYLDILKRKSIWVMFFLGIILTLLTQRVTKK